MPATRWTYEMDPAERLDFVMDFGGGDNPVLEAGETIASFTLAVNAAGAALGVQIETDPPYAPAKINGDTALQVWLSVDPLLQASTAFTVGAFLGVTATIVTTSAPPRRRERTWEIKVLQL